MLVENGGFGAQAAAPIARKVLEYQVVGKTEPGPAPTVQTTPHEGEDESD